MSANDASPEDWQNYLRVSAIVETFLARMTYDSAYASDPIVYQKLPVEPPDGYQLEGFAYLLCHCRVIKHGGSACHVVAGGQPGVQATPDGGAANEFAGFGGGAPPLPKDLVSQLIQRRAELERGLQALAVTPAEWHSYLKFFAPRPGQGPGMFYPVPEDFRFKDEPAKRELPYIVIERTVGGAPVPPRLDADTYPFRYGAAAADVQGNSLASFGKPWQRLYCLRFDDAERARGWLRDVIPFLATTEQVAAWNARRSYLAWAEREGLNAKPAAGELVVRPGDIGVAWTSLSLSHRGLTKLAPAWEFEGARFVAFRAGAEQQADRLHDTGDSRPANWRVGDSGERAVDAILTCAADRENLLKARCDDLEKLLRDGAGSRVQVVHAVAGEIRRDDDFFGFGEGTSQPLVRGYDGPMTPTPKDEAEPPANGWGKDLVPAGEFILGYPAATPPRPDAAPLLDWQRNGSFHVFRYLKIDPGLKDKLLGAMARALGRHGKAGRDLARAKLIGRYQDGTPLARLPSGAVATSATNDFTFEGDAAGQLMPLFAHIRKLDPRRNPPDIHHRILRRGIPYHLDDGEHGILFHAYMANIEDQFEYLQIRRANSAETETDRLSGPDALIGTTGQKDEHLQFVDESGKVKPIPYMRFVQTMGAVYAFAPSLSALKKLAAPPKPAESPAKPDEA